MYTDLITYEELQAANHGDVVVTYLDGVAEEARTIITDVTALIERTLRRQLIVRRHTQPFRTHDWYANDYDGGMTWMLYARQTPVVESLTEDIDPGPLPNMLVASNPRFGTVSYFAGYRRRDQVMGDMGDPAPDETLLPLGAGEVLEGLTIAPPVLPPDIRMAAIELSLHMLQHRERNLGLRTVQGIGSTTITVESGDKGFIERTLRRLDAHRYLSIG